MRRALRLLLPVLLLALLLPACSSLGYYGQAVNGQLQLLARRQPIDSLLEAESTPADLRARLALVQQLLDFAAQELALPVHDQYRSYVELDRPFVVWNVFATPEFSMQPKTWCFPVAGCVAYRGWFSEARARADARRLREAGFDVFVGGVAAYSTLGWFSDPVLSTVLYREDHRLAMLLFHELAHQVAYTRDDSVFNESFATAVEQLGLAAWLAANEAQGGESASERLAELARERELDAAFVALVQATASDLRQLYASGLEPDAMRAAKAARIARLREEYAAARTAWGDARYDAWFASEINNARLSSVATYNTLVPAFEALFAQCGGDWPCFHARAAGLARLPRAERESTLQAVLEFSPSVTSTR